MIKIEMKGAEFDIFLMILWAKIEYCTKETDCRKCSLLTLKTSYRIVEKGSQELAFKNRNRLFLTAQCIVNVN